MSEHDLKDPKTWEEWIKAGGMLTTQIAAIRKLLPKRKATPSGHPNISADMVDVRLGNHDELHELTLTTLEKIAPTLRGQSEHILSLFKLVESLRAEVEALKKEPAIQKPPKTKSKKATTRRKK